MRVLGDHHVLVREICKSFILIDFMFFSEIGQLIVHDSFACSDFFNNYDAVTCELGVVWLWLFKWGLI